MNRYEVAIVGSGFSGLTSAHYLKENGIEDICIFEKNSSLGGERFFTPVEESCKLRVESVPSNQIRKTCPFRPFFGYGFSLSTT